MGCLAGKGGHGKIRLGLIFSFKIIATMKYNDWSAPRLDRAVQGQRCAPQFAVSTQQGEQQGTATDLVELIVEALIGAVDIIG